MSSGIELRGDWRKLRHKFDRFTKLGQHLADETISDLADIVRDELHEVVNSSPSPVNAPRTVRRKGHETTLLETGGMSQNDSIVIQKEFEGDRHKYTISGNPNKIHRRTDSSGNLVQREDVSYEKLVGMLSKGDGGDLPARNMIPIAYDKVKPLLKEYVISEAGKYMRS